MKICYAPMIYNQSWCAFKEIEKIIRRKNSLKTFYLFSLNRDFVISYPTNSMFFIHWSFDKFCLIFIIHLSTQVCYNSQSNFITETKINIFGCSTDCFCHIFTPPPKPVLLTSRYQKAENTNGKVGLARSSLPP